MRYNIFNMKNSQNGSVNTILLLIILVLVLGFGIYYFAQNKSSTSQTTPTQRPVSGVPSQSTLKVSVKVVSPNGGETFKVGDTVAISWTSSNNTTGKVMIGLTSADGNTIVKEITNYLEGVADTGSYSWIIDSSIKAGAYKIVVQTPERPQYAYDVSDAPFYVILSQANTTFSVLSPKSGDVWKIGATYNIQFQNVPPSSYIQGWLQNVNDVNTGSAHIGVVDTGRNGNPSSNIQVTVPSQWCGGDCGAPQSVTPGQYRLLLTVYPSASSSSYQTYYSDYFAITH